jgi:hypothetical protein
MKRDQLPGHLVRTVAASKLDMFCHEIDEVVDPAHPRYRYRVHDPLISNCRGVILSAYEVVVIFGEPLQDAERREAGGVWAFREAHMVAIGDTFGNVDLVPLAEYEQRCAQIALDEDLHHEANAELAVSTA